MVDKVRMKVEGLRELGESLKALKLETRVKICRSMTLAAAIEVKDRAIVHAPRSDAPHRVEGMLVQPGNLKRNIILKRKTRTQLTSEHVVTIRGGEKGGFAARYGVIMEYGSVKTSPQPFLRKSFLEQLSSLPRKMAEVGKLKIEAAAKRLARKPKKSKP